MAVGLDLGNLLVHLRADSSHFTSVIGLATNGIRNFGRTVDRWMKRAAIAIAAYGAVSVKAFSTFQEQMANVSTMLDEQTMNYIPAYTKAIKNMAVEFGEGTDTLTKGLYDILSASVSAKDALKVLGVSAKAAKAGITTTAVAADAITTILNSYGMEADRAGEISDILFATVKRGKTTFAELAPNIGKVAAIASTAGLSIEEVGAALATMTRAGLQADLATTSLRAIMNTFLKPTDDAKAAAREFGFELGSASLKGLGLTGVIKKLKGATAEQLAVLMPNVRGLAGFAAALKQAEGMASDLELMLNSAGLTQAAYNKMINTLAFSLKQFWQAIKMVSVEIGSALAPDVEILTKLFIDNRMEITKWAMDVVARVLYLKDLFAEWVSYMKDDWKSGLKLALDATLILFEGFGKSIIFVMKESAIKAGDAFIKEFGLKLGKWLVDAAQPEGIIGKAIGITPVGLAARITMMEGGAALIQKSLLPSKDRPGIAEGLLGIKEETIKNLEDILVSSTKHLQVELRELVATRRRIAEEMQSATGAELEALFHELNAATEKYEVAKKNFLKATQFGRDATEKYNARLEENKNLLIATEKELNKTTTAFERFATMQERWLEDSGNIPGMPSTGISGAATTQFTVDSLNAYRSMYNEMGRMSKKTHEAMTASLKSQAEEYKRLGAEQGHIDIWYANQKQKIDIELLKSTGSVREGFVAAGMQMREDIVTTGQIAYEVAMKIQEGFGNAFADMLLEGAKFKDTMKALLKDVLRYMIQVSTMRMFAGAFGGIFAPASAPATASGQHGGEVVQSGWAKIHKGESLSGVNNEYGGGPPSVIINNNTGRPMKQDGGSSFDGKSWIVSVVVDNIQRNGAIPQAMGGVS